jgi:hypothetical protein
MRPMICLSALLAIAAGGQALALGKLADVTIVDRDSGARLKPYVRNGEYWIAGRPGARYGIEIHNSTGGRLLAVMAVDGVNIISGETAGWDQRGYVLCPQVSYTITGWRKSREEVAAFTFTASQNSYATLTGRPANVGVIGVALFRERAAMPVHPGVSGGLPGHAAAANPDRLAAPAAGADTGAAGGLAEEPKRSDPKLGTGHGEREVSVTTLTTFERLQSTPDEIVQIHYDSMSRLIAMGIVPAPGHGAPEPFPASEPGYVPDPPTRP